MVKIKYGAACRAHDGIKGGVMRDLIEVRDLWQNMECITCIKMNERKEKRAKGMEDSLSIL